MDGDATGLNGLCKVFFIELDTFAGGPAVFGGNWVCIGVLFTDISVNNLRLFQLLNYVDATLRLNDFYA